MPYQSPIAIIKETGLIESVSMDAKTLNLAKRVLLAELDLSPDNTLFFNGVQQNKEDILQFFDGLTNQDDWKWHELLANDKHLLFFLEWKTLPKGYFREEKLYETKEFKNFIAPYYIEAHVDIFSLAFRQADLKLAQKIVRLPQLWTQDGRSDFGRKFNPFLSQIITKINDETDNLRQSSEPQVTHIFLNEVCHKNQVEILSLLPDSTLGLRRQYAAALIGLSNQQYDSGQNKQAVKISETLLEHGIFDPDILKILWDNVEVYKKYVSPESPKGRRISTNNDSGNGTGCSWWYIMWGVFLLIRLLASF